MTFQSDATFHHQSPNPAVPISSSLLHILSAKYSTYILGQEKFKGFIPPDPQMTLPTGGVTSKVGTLGKP